MAVKKTAGAKRNARSSGKASAASAKKPMAAKAVQTKVTKVSAVEATPRGRVSLRKFNLTRMPILSAAIAEFIGTFLLAAIIVSIRNEPLWIMFALVGIVLVVGGVSGAHLNPAVTIGSWVTRRISAVRALSYILVQVLGAMLALVVATAYANAAPEQSSLFGQSATEVFTAAAIPEASRWGVFFAELLGATIFGFAFASAYKKRDNLATYALTIGFGLFVALTVAGAFASYITATAILNPAAAITLQALSFEVWPLAVYLLAPVVGATVGFALRDLLGADTDKPAAVTTRL